tara:strand:+ start:2399 stop:3139 length:741 start_codon:yes stop_codon:yes gene_type:complete
MSLLEDSLVKPLAKQDYKKAEQTIDGSGMKCLMLLSKSNRDGLLGKMCKALLTLKKAWYSDRCKMTWIVKVSKSNVSLFQLQVSVLGTTETEYGFLPVTYPTPTASDIEGGTAPDVQMKNGHFYRENKKGERWGVKLRDAVMYPTPSTRDYKGGSGTIKEKNGKYYRQSNKTGTKYGVRLEALMEYKEKMLPTPTNSEHKYRLKGNSQASNCLEAKARKHGGKLNPEFVEFLMGYPMGWTEIEPKE